MGRLPTSKLNKEPRWRQSPRCGISARSDGSADAGRVLRFAALAALPTIRVGVVEAASSIALGSRLVYLVTDQANDRA
jgi:hypothetical protein